MDRSNWRAPLALAAGGAMVLSLLPLTGAQAAEETPPARVVSDFACPEGEVPESGFTDISGNTFEEEIECLAWYEITTGGPGDLPANQYGPRLDVRRDQMASFIARMIDHADEDILGPYSGVNRFTDVEDDNVHVAAINRLADAGVVQGGPGGRPATAYGPALDVRRDQMAAFINRAIGLVLGDELQSDTNYFDDDDDSVHEDHINGLASGGIVQGRSFGVYAPDEPVRRDAMSAFIMRTMDLFVEQGAAAPPGELTGPPELTEFTVDDGDDDGELSEGDVLTLVFDRPVLVESSLTIEDQDGDATVLSDGEEAAVEDNGETLAVFETDAETLTVTVAGPVDATAGDDSDGVIDGTISITAAEGIFADNDEDGEVGEEDEEWVPDPANPANSADIGEGEPADGETSRPELVSAEILDTTSEDDATTANPAGTRVRYTFDERVTGATPAPGEFMLYEFDSAFVHTADAATVDTSDPESVIARFDDLVDEEQAAQLSVATVDIGAVTDDQTEVNPEGDAPVAEGGNTPLAAGITAAPDLLTVGTFRDDPDPEAAAGDTLVDFTFDEPAYHVAGDGSGYHLVLVDGTDVACTFVDGPAGSTTNGDGTTVHTVSCESTTVNIPQGNVARGYVDEGTVSDDADDAGADTDTGNLNPLQAAEVATGGTSDLPDLESATFQPESANGSDQVLYDFDEDVLLNTFENNQNPETVAPAVPAEGILPGTAAAVAARFRVYDTNGDEVVGTNAQRSTTAPDQVLVTFPDGTLVSAVGASVDDRAVVEATGDNRPNEEDEVGVANTLVLPEGGRTDAPDLTEVTLEAERDDFNDIEDYVGVYTFDEELGDEVDLTEEANVNKLRLWTADGTLYVCTVAEYGTASDSGADSVRCTEYRRADTVDDPPTGLSGSAASAEDLADAVLGTVDDSVVDDADEEANLNPEGAAAATVET